MAARGSNRAYRRCLDDSEIPSGAIVAVLGTSLTVSRASSYYIHAVLAVPMAEQFRLAPVRVFGASSMAMVVSAMIGPCASARIDGAGGAS